MRRISVVVLALTLVLGVPGVQATLPASVHGQAVPTLAPLLREVTPAVVNISVKSRVSVQGPLLTDPFFRHFFNMPEAPAEQERQSAGSGIIIDGDKGHVITNHHVIDNASEILITLKDKRTFEAKLVGSDAGTDIALLEIEADGLHALELGDSDRLEVGDFVVAIGNPFGLGQTVTSGIVSALGRSGINVEGYEDFIQTDASINPGNSGGALINLRGELIGINTAIIGPAGGNIGIGFAVPSSMAAAVVEQLVAFGEVRRGRLGILIQDLTPELASALGLDVSSGTVISAVEPDSPAEAAGLKAGDVIVSVDGQKVHDSANLRSRIGLVTVGESVELEVLRDGRTRRVTATVGKGAPRTLAAGESVAQLSGVVVKDIGPDSPLHGRVEEGVWVASVERGSAAWRYGLRPDDAIVAVNRQPVGNVRDFQTALESVGRVIALNVVRDGAGLLVVIQ